MKQKPKNPDAKRDKAGVKAQRRDARKRKAKRREFETGWRW